MARPARHEGEGVLVAPFLIGVIRPILGQRQIVVGGGVNGFVHRGLQSVQVVIDGTVCGGCVTATGFNFISYQ